MHPLGQHHCKILPRSPRPLCLHRGCASELATAHPESLLAAPQKEQNVFVPQTPACCRPGFTASEEQAGCAVPLAYHPYHKGEKLSLAASSQSQNRSVRRPILVCIRACAMKDQRQGGNVLADKAIESFDTTATIALQ